MNKDRIHPTDNSDERSRLPGYLSKLIFPFLLCIGTLSYCNDNTYANIVKIVAAVREAGATNLDDISPRPTFADMMEGAVATKQSYDTNMQSAIFGTKKDVTLFTLKLRQSVYVQSTDNVLRKGTVLGMEGIVYSGNLQDGTLFSYNDPKTVWIRFENNPQVIEDINPDAIVGFDPTQDPDTLR